MAERVICLLFLAVPVDRFFARRLIDAPVWFKAHFSKAWVTLIAVK
jgi:hypothetical protein